MKLGHVFILACASLFSGVSAAGDWYLGSGLSQMKLAQVEFETTNVSSILAGYEFEDWSVEGSYNVSEEHNKFYGGDQKINMYHLYSVYRSQEDLYYKIKLGITNERYKFYDNSGNLKLDDVHTGVARGIGVGYRYGQFSVEMEYSWLGRSLETFGVGMRYTFN